MSPGRDDGERCGYVYRFVRGGVKIEGQPWMTITQSQVFFDKVERQRFTQFVYRPELRRD